MADHTSEGLVYNIEEDHEELQFIHEVIARGLTLVATPCWDHLEARQAIEDEHNYWFNNY
jgi:hypothetical protein